MSVVSQAGSVASAGHLKGSLGFWSLMAVGVGLDVSQGVMVIMLQGAGFGGYGFLMTTFLAYLLALTYCFSFSELTLMFKSPGSIATFTEVAIGNFPAIVATFSGHVVVAMFALSAELVLIELMILEVTGLDLPPGLLLLLILAAFSVLNIVGVDLLYCWGALVYVSTETLSTSPLPHYAYAESVMGRAGLVFLALTAFTATCSTVNSSLAAVPRIIYGMAQNGQTFAVLGKLHPQYNTPWVSIVFVAAITALPILVYGVSADSILLLLVGAAIAWLVAYIIVHIDVIVLRRRYPQIERPFRTPLYPLPQIVGIAGMAYAIFHASPSPELTVRVFSVAGLTLVAGAVLAAVWVKFVMRKGLFEPEPAGTHLDL